MRNSHKHDNRSAIAVVLFAIILLGLSKFALAADMEDAARAILRCYHPTGGFIRYKERGKWGEANYYGASYSEVIDIDFRGAWTGNAYRLMVALLSRQRNGDTQIRAEVISDDAILPPNPNCPLRDWVD